jgi:ABC-type glycerol-3-phosphate transport system substrate-binding protein
MKRKHFFIALAAAALACVLLLGMGGRDSGGASAGSRKGLISDGSITLSIFTGGLGNLVNSYEYKDNLFTRKVVDETGINLKVEGATSMDFRQKLNVQLSSGDYPDIVLMDNNNLMTLNDLTYYASQGIIIPLDSYNPTKYPNIAKVFKEFPAVNESLRGPTASSTPCPM